jgi:hypothetical protein
MLSPRGGLAACKSSRLFSRIVTQVCTTAPASLLFLQLSVSVHGHRTSAITQRCEALRSLIIVTVDGRKRLGAHSRREREKALASRVICLRGSGESADNEAKTTEQLASPTIFSPLVILPELFRLR